MPRKPRSTAPHPADDRTDPRGFAVMLARFLEALAVTKYSPRTVDARRKQVREFIAWAAERDLCRPADISRAHLEAYRRHLHHYRKVPTAAEALAGKQGQPLALGSQQTALNGVRVFFHWLSKHHWILFNPASELELPRMGKRLPKDVLSAAEAEHVLSLVDLDTHLGLRDRAILETLYSTGIRRTELARVTLRDLDRERGTLRIRYGKGGKERVVPIGERATAWIEKYVCELRPELVSVPDDGTVFLSRDGKPLTPDALAQRVQTFLKRAGFGGRGCCHLFRHTAATLMLEGGADIRYIQAMLGHAELSTTEIYTRVSIQKLKAIHDATHPAAHLRRQGTGYGVQGSETEEQANGLTTEP